jgi:predicted transcriptional regulator
MTLREWMDREGLTQAKAGARLGIKQAEVSMYLAGRTPTLERALLFEAKTGGKVKPKDWVTQPAGAV